MARNEADREDLLREATALVQRGEFVLAGHEEPVTIGFRRDGAGSIFLGVDPVYQFNAQGELRRGYLHGKLLKAQQGKLVEMTRVRSETALELHSRTLTADETHQVLTQMQDALSKVKSALQDPATTLRGQVPADGDIQAQAIGWLNSLPTPPRIAAGPNVAK